MTININFFSIFLLSVVLTSTILLASSFMKRKQLFANSLELKTFLNDMNESRIIKDESYPIKKYCSDCEEPEIRKTVLRLDPVLADVEKLVLESAGINSKDDDKRKNIINDFKRKIVMNEKMVKDNLKNKIEWSLNVDTSLDGVEDATYRNFVNGVESGDPRTQTNDYSNSILDNNVEDT